LSDTRRSGKATPSPGSLSPLGQFVVRHRRNRLLKGIAGLCRRYLNFYGNLSYDLNSNGEAFALRTVSAFRPKVIFDVGANVGDWTMAAKSACPDATIHSFEIAPPTFQQLVANTRSLKDVYCNNVGLSDRPGSIQLRHYDQFPALTTHLDYPHPFASSTITAEVTTGDCYAASHGIHHIDLLKIDVEGMEASVVRGFSNMFFRHAIDLVQFEYGQVNIVSRFLLRDFYEFFREHGYVTGKIFPDYVDFREYNFRDEDFMGPNYLACHTSKLDYLQALSGARSPHSVPAITSATDLLRSSS